MAPSEWTRCVRAIRDHPVVADSAPSVNTMGHIAYCSPIAVSLFLVALSVSYVEWTVWWCSQIWPFVGIGSLGMLLHRNCNAIGDATKSSPRIPSTCLHYAILSLLIIHIIPSGQISVAIENPSPVPSGSCLTTNSYLCNHLGAAADDSHSEYLQTNGCRCFSHLYRFRDRTHVTRVFTYYDQHQGYPVINESSILVQELDFE